MKQRVGKAVGVYDRPAQRKWPRVAAIAVAALAAAAASLFFWMG